MYSEQDKKVEESIPEVGEKIDMGGLEAEVIMKYTSFQAVSDGVLFDVQNLPFENIENSPFRFITTNLLRRHGYLNFVPEAESEMLNLPNILDLLNNCIKQCHEQSKEDETRVLFVCNIETPNGEKATIWAYPNEIPNKWTLLLPEDY